MKLERIGILLGFLLSSVSFATSGLSAKQGKYLQSFIFAFLAWIGYLITHYSENGTFMSDPEKKLEDGLDRRFFLLGIILFASGFSIGSYSASLDNLLGASLGCATLLLGYYTMHYSRHRKLT